MDDLIYRAEAIEKAKHDYDYFKGALNATDKVARGKRKPVQAMKKYADMNSVNEKLMHLRDKCGNEEMAFALNWALQMMRNIKTVDAEEVVLCKYCRLFEEDERDTFGYCRLCHDWRKGDDFCSKAVRRER